MSTSGGDDPNLGDSGSDPYRAPGEHQPGGATPPPPPPPGAPNPYGGAPNPYATSGATTAPDAPMDGVSIASLVTGILCCTGPIAVVLGIIGVVRTKAGQRRGRWMAVVGIVVGVLATLTVTGAVIFGVWFSNQLITPDNAETGQCADVQAEGDTVILLEKDCNDGHDAEIVHVGEYDASADGGPGGRLTTESCFQQLSENEVAALEEADIAPDDIDVIAPDPDDMSDGDPYACYVEPGRTLDGPLLD